MVKLDNRLLAVLSVFVFSVAKANPGPLDSNLVYRSPFANGPEFARDTVEIHANHARAYAKRQLAPATGFKNQQYPSFYGSNFANAPFVWNAGLNFTHAVASGDPFDTSVILWTRAVPLPSDKPSNPSSTPFLPDQSVPICVRFEIATDEGMKHVVDSGMSYSSIDVDYTVKVEANGLRAETEYFYQFADCTNKANTSPIGRTRTLPNPNTPAHQVNGGKPFKIAVFSCSQFQAGWFNAYGVAAHNATPHIFVHLGDYMYESTGNGAPIGRKTLGRELSTLRDYRQRLGQYRTDESLRFAHQNFPFITVWDDHEVADNAWKAGTTDSNDTEAGCAYSGAAGTCYSDRKLSAVRAYHEWMPIRQVDADDKLRIWRSFPIGKLMDLIMLDTRQYDRDVTDVNYNRGLVRQLRTEPSRSLMGPLQEKWLNDTLSESKKRGAVWRVMGQQIVFTQVNESGFDYDAWDGYTMNRARLIGHLYQQKIDNTIITSGDSHENWVGEIANPNDTVTYNPDTGHGAVGVEFAGTAVTSGASVTGNLTGVQSTPAAADARSAVMVNSFNSEDLQWNEGSYRGCFVLSITAEKLTADYYAMRNVSFPNLDFFISATFEVKAGANRLTRPIAGGKVLAGALKPVPYLGPKRIPGQETP